MTGRVITAILCRECALAFRSGSEFINPLIFFVIVISLFPLAISSDPKILNLIAPGVIWVAALLATLLSLDRLFKSDFEDGSLEQIILSGDSLIVIVFAKVISYWLLVSVPLLLLTPVICLMYGLPVAGMIAILSGILPGMPTLCFLGAIGSALTVGLRNSGLLLTLLVLPFYIPVLIFATTAVSAAMSGLPYGGELALLGAFLVLSMTFCPFAIAQALRISVNY